MERTGSNDPRLVIQGVPADQVRDAVERVHRQLMRHKRRLPPDYVKPVEDLLVILAPLIRKAPATGPHQQRPKMP
jgi:hypothetical protein